MLSGKRLRRDCGTFRLSWHAHVIEKIAGMLRYQGLEPWTSGKQI